MAGRSVKDSGSYGGGLGGPSSNGQGQSTRDRNLDAIGDIAAGRPTSNAGPGGPVGGTPGNGGKTSTGATTKKKLPPGLNPLKYQTNPTQQFKPTAGNLLKGATLVGDVLSGPMAIGLEAVKSELGLSPVDNMLDPFKDRMPDTTGGDYDKSENINQSIGQANSTMGPDTTASALQTAEQKKKKKVATKPGFNLLTGAGGTLLGS